MRNPERNKLHLWRLHPRSGFWQAERDVTPETAQQWLDRFQRDDPQGIYLVSARRPTVKAGSDLLAAKHRARFEQEAPVCPDCEYERATGRVAPIHRCEEDGTEYRRLTANGDLTWRDTYAREYQVAEREGLDPPSARERAAERAWADYRSRTGQQDYWRNGAMPAGFDAFDVFDEITPEQPVLPGEEWRTTPVFRDVKRGDVLRVGPQSYEVLAKFDNFHVMVQKPGAKRKAFALRQSGPEVEVREQRGSQDTTYATAPLLVVPWAAVTTLHQANEGGYYVWLLDPRRNWPLDEGPLGPYDLPTAKQTARIGAQAGRHDRAVSRGCDPQAASFEFVRRYAAGSGDRLI